MVWWRVSGQGGDDRRMSENLLQGNKVESSWGLNAQSVPVIPLQLRKPTFCILRSEFSLPGLPWTPLCLLLTDYTRTPRCT